MLIDLYLFAAFNWFMRGVLIHRRDKDNAVLCFVLLHCWK
jgi:hypothetical protein